MDYKTYINSSQHRTRMMYYQYIVPNPFPNLNTYNVLGPIFYDVLMATIFPFMIYSYPNLPAPTLCFKSRLKTNFYIIVPVTIFCFSFCPSTYVFSTTKYQESVSFTWITFPIIFYWLKSILVVLLMLYLVSFKNSPGKKGSKSRYRDASWRLRNTGLEQRCPTVLIRSPHLKHS
jgi:hypothetical protein